MIGKPAGVDSEDETSGARDLIIGVDPRLRVPPSGHCTAHAVVRDGVAVGPGVSAPLGGTSAGDPRNPVGNGAGERSSPAADVPVPSSTSRTVVGSRHQDRPPRRTYSVGHFSLNDQA